MEIRSPKGPRLDSGRTEYLHFFVIFSPHNWLQSLFWLRFCDFVLNKKREYNWALLINKVYVMDWP